MKTILLMKHGESSWDNKGQNDWYRPLSEQGRMNAMHAGARLLSENMIPDFILTSSAARARQTADLVAVGMSYRGKITGLDELYLAEMEDYFRHIQRLPDEVSRVLVIGHSPNLDCLLQVVTEKVVAIAPSAVAYVELPINTWSSFTKNVVGDLVKFIRVHPSFPVFYQTAANDQVTINCV